MIIIGITGTLGAGKGTVVEYIKEKYGFKHFAVSDTFLVGELRKRGVEPDRLARRTLANELRAQGPTKLMEAVYEMAKPSIEKGGHIIIEPQHTIAEVEFIKSIGGVMFAVDADFRLRYERIIKRGSEKDNITLEQFIEQQQFELKQTDPNKNNLMASMSRANYIFMNNGSVEELHTEIDKVMGELLKNEN